MKKKLKQILLIDDSVSDNFIHARRIRNVNVTESIITKKNGREALDYLTEELPNNQYQQPELIFLDINMPVMNGWEFLDEYDKLMDKQKALVVLAMLTTSTAESDKEKAKNYGHLSTFLEKPLKEEDLLSIIQKHFPRLMEEE
ncbi:response regulator [Neolewinella antarctica]|uniref:CheY-like chemotaxis protein n=1 Tax=Neolewinella antarctica TaxID=442734 RepID=A0ABX0XEF7_9BACT|nr:response regulator [Neolewinella antarctica]NJC27289.1 CheY-like chemotaxis protein [Neolewinella antarctica]